MTTPGKEYLRYGQVLEWLESAGISRYTARCLIEDGTIQGKPIRKWFYYSRAQIQRDVLDRLNQPAEGPASKEKAEVRR